MQVIFTIHAKERMLQRGINENTVKEIIEKPDFIENTFLGRKIAVKMLVKKWNVVYIEEENKLIVLSVYFD